MVQVLFIATTLLSFIYAGFLCWCIRGWMRLQPVDSNQFKDQQPVSISVIIPARNEAENIFDCLSDFIRQDYPFDSFEVIVADDHSNDDTSAIVQKFIHDHPALRIQLLQLKAGGENKTYKKYAITSAIDISAGELIITTDADCRRGRMWLKSIAGYYASCHPEMISAPVIFEGEKSWLEKIQSLEFLGLVGIGAAAIRNGYPFLCNGANLAFSKEVFRVTGGYDAAKNISSGEDTQLMLKIAPRGKERIQFLKSIHATVRTKAQKSMQELLDQRKRWASKIPVQMNAFTICIAIVAYFLHAGLLISGFGILYSGNLYCFFIPLFIKMIPEFILLTSVAGFFKKSKLLYLFLPAQFIYPIYISVVGISSFSKSYQWKGREVK
ncbi:MAG: glycosyltransferase [Bacteroidota bacterium]